MHPELKVIIVGIAALFLLSAPAMASSVKITNLNLGGETVTVMNTGATPVDVSNWKITDEGVMHTFTFPSGTILNPGASVVILSGPDQVGGAGTISWTKQSVWNNEGDVATLWNAQGTRVSSSDGYDAPDAPVQTPTTAPTIVATATVPVATMPVPVVTTAPPSPVTVIVTPVTVVTVAPVPTDTGTYIVYPISQPVAVVTSVPTAAITPVSISQPASPISRFGARRYLVGNVPKSPPTGISVGTGTGSTSTRGRTALGTGVATGVKPPAGRFVRWSPSARWKAGIK